MNHFSVFHTFNHMCTFLWEKNQGILEIDVTTTLTILTESQNYRITEWLELEGTTVGSSGPTLFLRQLHLDLAAQDCARASFRYDQRRRYCSALSPSKQKSRQTTSTALPSSTWPFVPYKDVRLAKHIFLLINSLL